MDKLSKSDLAGLDLSAHLGARAEQPSVPPEVDVTEELLPVPAELAGRSASLSHEMAQLIGRAQADAMKAEQRLYEAQERADAERRRILLRTIEALDTLEDVIAGFRVADARSPRGAPRGAGEPVSQAGFDRIALVAKMLRQQVLDGAGVKEVPVEPGQAVNPERDQVIDVVRRKRLADGTVAAVVRRAYYDKKNSCFLRKAVVKAVRNP